jgi:hypothetical protein
MERTTVYLPPDLKRRLVAVAARRGVPEARLIREALDRHLDEEVASVPEPVGQSTDGGVAGRLDDALRELGFGR